MPRVLVVDNEDEFRDLVLELLRSEGIEAVGASRAGEALGLARSRAFDLALVDNHLDGGEDGKELACSLRRESASPGMKVAIMSADRRPAEQWAALERCKADEYLVKVENGGTSDHVLCWMPRIRRLLPPAPETRGGLLDAGGYRLDVEARSLELRGGMRPVRLPPRLCLLARALMERPDRAFERGRLMSAGQFPPSAGPNALDRSISRLRRVMGDPEGEVLYTVPGVGYMFRVRRRAP